MSTVLVVDDEIDVAEVVDALLTDAGYTVRVARNGREGLARLAQEKPSVMLLDVMMPVLDGAGVLHAMAEDPALRGVPVVVMSAGSNVRALAEQYGCAAYLQKPFDVDQLLATVARITPPDTARGGRTGD